MENKINEEDKFKIHVSKKDLENQNTTKQLAMLKKKNPNIEFDLEPTAKPTTTSVSSMMEQPEAVIQPQDQATLKYLSNVIDNNTGEISKPFIISGKKYQMVRAITPDKNIMLGVYCFDDFDGDGNNLIHPSDHFEKTIALPMKEKLEKNDVMIEDEYDFSASEREFHDKESLINYLNLSDIGPGYKHFFVNITNGDVSAKFRTTKEMIKSGIKLGPNEDYMDLKTLKKFRFGEYFKNDIKEEQTDNNRDVSKLKSDVKKLATLIKNKFSGYLSKLDKPIEQAQFLSAMAGEIGVPLSKLSSIINTYKDIAKNEEQPNVTMEVKVIKKQELEEAFKRRTKIIKVKDIR